MTTDERIADIEAGAFAEVAEADGRWLISELRRARVSLAKLRDSPWPHPECYAEAKKGLGE